MFLPVKVTSNSLPRARRKSVVTVKNQKPPSSDTLNEYTEKRFQPEMNSFNYSFTSI